MVKQDTVKVAVIHRRLPHYRLPLYQGILATNPDILLHVYYRKHEKTLGGSGISAGIKDQPYVKRLKTYDLNMFGKTFLLQPSIVRHIFKNRYDLIICEGTLMLISSIMILLIRRIMGRKNALWLKGWPNAHLDGRLTRLMKKAFLRLAQFYIVYGNESKKSLSAYGIPEDKITIAQNTVEVSHYFKEKNTSREYYDDPEVKEILKRGYSFIFNIGRLVAKKRIGDLLKAYDLLQSNHPDEEIALVIAGTGPESKYLERLSKDLGIKKVHFLGAISDNDAYELFSKSLCCVFPGAVGLALNQAMACGKPIICADEPGPDTELLTHMVNGLRFPYGNVQKMKDLIIQIIRDKDLQKKLGENAQNTIKRKATMDKMIDSFVIGIRSAVSNKV